MAFSLVIFELLPLPSVCLYGCVCTCVYSGSGECTFAVFILSLAASLLWSAITVLEVSYALQCSKEYLTICSSSNPNPESTVCKYLLAFSTPGLSFGVLLGAKLTKAAHFACKEECIGQQAAETWENSFRRQVMAHVPTLHALLKHLLVGRIIQTVLEEYWVYLRAKGKEAAKVCCSGGLCLRLCGWEQPQCYKDTPASSSGLGKTRGM